MNAVWIALLSSSLWGVINILIGAFLVRSRTKAETLDIEGQSEDRVYARLRADFAKALDRATAAEERADKADAQSNMQGRRIMELVKMFEQHIRWDKAIKEKLIGLGVPEAEIPPIPELNPYKVFELTAADE